MKESSVGSESNNKPWDHAWDTEEIRNNRRNWSLAGDSGLLKHLQEFSENLTKKANETQDVINSMASQINETTILVDNIMNTSLALANTQFIESRVQEDNIEIEQPTEDVTKQSEDDCEFSATDLLFSVCESIKQGLSIMDEKYEKVEVTASDTEDDDDNAIASVILRPKDPYRDRPLPYVFGSEQWNASNKVGLESSSSESELSDDNEDSISDIEEKNVENILSSNNHSNSGINRLSSTSSESNEFNIEENNISNKDNDNQFHARRQETLNSDTEPTTPSSVLPRIQNINNAPPSFAEELAKRLGNVLPSQKNAIVQDINEQVINCSKDDIFTSVNDADVFNNKSDNLFSEGKNLFVDEVPSSIKNLPVRAINKNIIPPSIDVPPPLSIISSAPKSTIDDLFGDVEDSDDSDDIFSKKVSKDIYSCDNEIIRSEVISKQKNLNTENTQNISNITTSTSEINDKVKDLFEEQKQDDIFKIDTKKIQSPNIASIDPIKKPIGGVSILGKIDIHSSNKFLRRPSSTSSSESDFIDHPINSNSAEVAISKNNNNTDGINVFPSFQAGKNIGNSRNTFSENNTSSTSSIPTHQTSIVNTAGSSTGY
ncbi:PREDICTED: WASH complex subunit FAM21-like [Ceratosolen solmsi marchali]|uniref:WASH complex subunit FAM21-like n=1 Tax=Ceratosolen solmsi marchali TaxID=326594 RepID=A0AAJ6YDJ7_9HYME|nr:PREDICTED: WASH complex subunit FAM21-like [Ceratosolen solmsi marchali]